MISIAKKKQDQKIRARYINEMKISLQKLFDICEPATAILAVSSSGHLICQYSRNIHPVKQVADMKNCLVSLGESAVCNLAMGRCQHIISENEQGPVLFTHIAEDIILVTLTADQSSLGMLIDTHRAYVKKTNLNQIGE